MPGFDQRTRREALKGIGAAGVASMVGLAGCSGGGDGGDGGSGDGGSGDGGSGDGGTTTTGGGGSGVQMPDTFTMAEPSPVFAGFAIPEYTNFTNKMEQQHGSTVEGEPYDGYTSIAGSMVQEQVQVGTLSVPALVNSVNEGLPFVVIGSRPMQVYNTIVTRPGTSWEDIDSITVHAPLSSSEAAARMMVEAELGSVDAVEYDYQFGSTTRLSTLDAGEADAVEAFFGAALTAEEQEFGEIMARGWEYDKGSNLPGSYWGVLAPLLDENEDIYREFARLLQESFDEMYQEDPAEMAERVANSGASFPEFSTSVIERQFSTLQDIGMWAEDYQTSISADRLEDALDYNITYGSLEEDQRVDPAEVIDSRFEDDIGS